MLFVLVAYYLDYSITYLLSMSMLPLYTDFHLNVIVIV